MRKYPGGERSVTPGSAIPPMYSPGTGDRAERQPRTKRRPRHDKKKE